MIIGIGTDLVQNNRIKSLYEKYEGRFADKVLSKKKKKNL